MGGWIGGREDEWVGELVEGRMSGWVDWWKGG